MAAAAVHAHRVPAFHREAHIAAVAAAHTTAAAVHAAEAAEAHAAVAAVAAHAEADVDNPQPGTI